MNTQFNIALAQPVASDLSEENFGLSGDESRHRFPAAHRSDQRLVKELNVKVE